MSPSQTLGVVDLVRQSLLEGYGCDILHGTRDLGVAGVVAVARLAGVVEGSGEGVLDGEGGLLLDLLGDWGGVLGEMVVGGREWGSTDGVADGVGLVGCGRHVGCWFEVLCSGFGNCEIVTCC